MHLLSFISSYDILINIKYKYRKKTQAASDNLVVISSKRMSGSLLLYLGILIMHVYGT